MVHWTNTLFGPSPVFLSNSKQSIHKHVQIIIFVAQHSLKMQNMTRFSPKSRDFAFCSIWIVCNAILPPVITMKTIFCVYDLAQLKAITILHSLLFLFWFYFFKRRYRTTSEFTHNWTAYESIESLHRQFEKATWTKANVRWTKAGVGLYHFWKNLLILHPFKEKMPTTVERKWK